MSKTSSALAHDGALNNLSAREVDRIASLSVITTVLNGSHDSEEVLRSVLEVVLTMMSAQRGMVILDSPDVCRPQTFALDMSTCPWSLEFPHSSSLVARCLKDRDPLILLDTQTGPVPGESTESLRLTGTRSVICQPLVSRGRILGLLYLDNLVSARVFQPTDLRLLGIIADLIAATIDRSNAVSELVEQAVSLELALAKLEEAHTEVKCASEETIQRLAAAAEYRDDETGLHVQRVSLYAEALARRVGLAEETVSQLKLASQMHDIGKLGIPDHILLKPGRFNEQERAKMQQHATIGAKILSGSKSPIIRMAEAVARTHHERWDGLGYPEGLAGETIPLVGRLVALADVFDALTTARCYKPAFSVEESLAIIKEQSGQQFEPRLVEAFLEIRPELERIKNRLCPSNGRESTSNLWERMKPLVDQRVEVLESASRALQEGELAAPVRERALEEAHRLIGVLGSFGYPEGSACVAKIELMLREVSPEPAAFIELVGQLRELLGHAPEASSLPALKKEERSLRLLLVEDDEIQREALAEEARLRGLILQEAPDLAAARRAVATQTPDAVLLDLIITRSATDALHFLHELKSEHPDLPIVVLTAESDFSIRLEVARLGATAYLQKPQSANQVIDEVIRRCEQSRYGPARVLVVDDDPVSLAIIARTLAKQGMEVDTLKDASLIWDRLTANTPDMLLLDFSMPGVSGEDVCRVIRNDPVYANLPIVVLTAHNDQRVLDCVLEAGADDFLAKPVRPKELISRLAGRLSRVQQLNSLSETDFLTGLPNRRKGSQAASQMLALARRQGRPFVLAVLDLDHFKRVNDRFGHAAGDEVLRATGQLLTTMFRKEDVVARWGGEEFLIGFYGITKEVAARRVEALRERLSKQVFGQPSRNFRVTLSGGLAEFPAQGPDFETVLRLADQALYLAKEGGRDQISSLAPCSVSDCKGVS